eukprot:XP_003730162.2 PREDICTED: parathyroid hormone 2 receptor [Strongylocentrotus purpuratus]
MYGMKRRQHTRVTMVTLFIVVSFLMMSVSASSQDNIIRQIMTAKLEAKNSCTWKMARDPPTEGVHCNRTWDGILCWPDTLANSVHRLPCPIYLTDTTTRVDMYASKSCEADGIWYSAENNETWTNYTMCRAADEDNSIYEKIYQSLQIVYSIGYSLSLISLVVAMGIFLYFRKLRCTRNMIHMHLFMSFILRAIFVFIRDIIQAQNEAGLLKSELQAELRADSGNDSLPVDRGNPGCKVAFTLIQYFLVANFYWLLVEGVYLHSLITLAVFSEKSIYRYIALGWGCPAFVVVPWAIVRSFKESSG